MSSPWAGLARARARGRPSYQPSPGARRRGMPRRLARRTACSGYLVPRLRVARSLTTSAHVNQHTAWARAGLPPLPRKALPGSGLTQAAEHLRESHPPRG